VPDLGLTLRVKVSATNAGGTAGPVESGQTAIVKAPPPSGGGGGGGGGTSDLVAGIFAPATARIGDSIAYQVTAQDLGSGGSDHVVATITLPTGVTLEGVTFDRGQGCTGTTVLTCQLDFLNGTLVAHVRIDVLVRAAGSLVATVVLSASQSDVNPANNTASATTLVAPAEPVLPAPKVARTGTRPVTPVRSGTKASVTFGASLNRAARVQLTVKPVSGKRPLLLRAGTRIGPRTIRTSAFKMSSGQGAGAFTVKAVVSGKALAKGKSYVATLVATTPDGRSSTLAVRFKG